MTSRPAKTHNEKSILLNDQENDAIFNNLGSGCFTLATAVVQLYLAEAPQTQTWNKRFCGVACFVKDNPKRSYFIRLYDPNSKQLQWEQELYYHFKYKTPREYFHTFEAHDCQAALNFASATEADIFKKVVEGKLLERHKKRLEKKEKHVDGIPARLSGNQAPKGIGTIDVGSGAPPAAMNVTLNNVNTAPSVKENKKSKGKDKGKRKLTKADISTPTDFCHVSHVGWDPQKGLDTNHLDPEMKTLFEQIGINDQSDVDEETMDFIYDFVDKHGGLNAVRDDLARRQQTPASPQTSPQAPIPPFAGGPSARPPPPPNRAPVGAPPPLPPQRGGAPPPPPPQNSGVGMPLPPSPHRAQAPPPHPNKKPEFRAPPPPPSSVPAPPPPPPTAAAPAPPPPPPLGFGDAAPPPGNPGRGALLDQIHQGTTLKKVTPAERQGGDRGGLLDQIKSGTTLKRVDHKNELPLAASKSQGIVGALASALAARKNVIQDSDEDDNSDEADVDDDDEWDN